MTKSLKILIVSFGSAGDVYPFVALGKALIARGHEVVMIQSPYFEEVIVRNGLKFQPVGTIQEFLSMVDHPDLWHPRRAMNVISNALEEFSEPVYQVICDQYEPGRTVIVGSSLAMVARIASEKLQAPMATVHLQPTCIFSSIDLAKLGKDIPAFKKWPRWFKRGLIRCVQWHTDRIFTGWINRIRAKLGLTGKAKKIVGQWWNSPDCVLGFFPDWFCQPQDDWPSNTHLVGFPMFEDSADQALSQEVEQFLGSGSSPIVFTPGSACLFGQSFFQAAVEACEILNRRGILLTKFPEQLPENLPETIRHFDYVPLGNLLKHCAALVYHGGIGTLSQALAAGVPHLVMPMAHDQPDNAQRLVELGVGSYLYPRKFRGQQVAQKLKELLTDQDVALNCQKIADRMQENHSMAIACDKIEKLAP